MVDACVGELSAVPGLRVLRIAGFQDPAERDRK
jgi:hypothetical protein